MPEIENSVSRLRCILNLVTDAIQKEALSSLNFCTLSP